MAERLTIAAVIASNRWLNQTQTVAFAAAGEREPSMARVHAVEAPG
jgi:hypothetical protein